MIRLSADIPQQAREWRNHPDIWKWCRQFTLISHDAHMRWLDRIERDPSIKMFGVWVGDVPIGVCGFTSIDPHNQSAEFSLYIAPEHQRNGHGKKTLITLLGHGFLHMNLNRIWGESFDGNPAKKMFSDIGMKSEGVLRQTYFRAGRFIDSEIYSLLRSEYVARFGDCDPGPSEHSGSTVVDEQASPQSNELWHLRYATQSEPFVSEEDAAKEKAESDK